MDFAVAGEAGLEGLEKYQRVIFDFAGIEMVGQAFCDEVFLGV